MTKKVLIVSAHPEPRSMTASLTTFAAEELRAAGQEVVVSDLYAMKWRAALDADDYPGHDPAERFDIMAVSAREYAAGRLSADIAAEQEKLRWADAVILQFPLWWFGPPAILKGWIDRVFTAGFAYGDTGRPLYGGGHLSGRRALVSVTVGGRESAYTERGIHGPLEHLLFPLHHGLFRFTGMDVLPPFAMYGTNAVEDAAYATTTRAYAARLRALFTQRPIPYRTLTGGDYDRDMRLLPGRETPGAAGFDLHVR
jgi:NAD(P)H dehydrogenase (quinone)